MLQFHDKHLIPIGRLKKVSWKVVNRAYCTCPIASRARLRMFLDCRCSSCCRHGVGSCVKDQKSRVGVRAPAEPEFVTLVFVVFVVVLLKKEALQPLKEEFTEREEIMYNRSTYILHGSFTSRNPPNEPNELNPLKHPIGFSLVNKATYRDGNYR
uniref:Uncharacterized protein n=1 Tax=Vespula pensylvanica TaxID=30213 RepID=A0A834NXS6_VESPE|nr:hypothetical protein H0235_010461 [Vespula pensylvanica]